MMRLINKSDKDRRLFSMVGKIKPRIDAVEKVTGKAIYTDDMELPKTLCGKILRSHYPHAKIIRVEKEKAKRLLGVKAVISAEDISPILTGLTIKDTPVFAIEKVRFIGEPIAAVAAIDEDTAMEAIELIDIEYEQLPAIFESEEALKPEAPLVHDKIENYELGFFVPPAGDKVVRKGNICSHISIDYGDIAKGIEESDLLIFEDIFKTQRQHQCYMEPQSAVASFEPMGKLTIWISGQGVFVAQSILADALAMPKNRIRVVSPYVGGGFGGKVVNLVMAITAHLSKISQRPVKITLTREEEFITGRPRHLSKIRLITRVKNKGNLVAREVEMLLDTGAYSHHRCC